MRTLNKEATKIFNNITEGLGYGLEEDNNYLKLDNSNGAFMPLVVECIGQTDFALIFSFAHYFKQNGDLCQDPEMLFFKHDDGDIYPFMFQQAIPPVYEESIFKDVDGQWKCKPRLQTDHTKFANMWLKNIKTQQKL